MKLSIAVLLGLITISPVNTYSMFSTSDPTHGQERFLAELDQQGEQDVFKKLKELSNKANVALLENLKAANDSVDDVVDS